MKNKKLKIFFLGIMFFGFGGVVENSQAAIIFENDFDGLDNWVATYPVGGYPNPTDTAGASAHCNPGANGVGVDCNFSSGGFAMPLPFNVVRTQGKTCATREFQGMYINSVPGYPYESSGACYDGSGKCLTIWEELCGDNFDHSDNDLGIALPNEYEEAWIRFRIKIGRRADGSVYHANHHALITASTQGTQRKLWHFQHWDSETGASPFNYFSRDQDNYPGLVGGYQNYKPAGMSTYGYSYMYEIGRQWCNEMDVTAYDAYYTNPPTDTAVCYRSGDIAGNPTGSLRDHYGCCGMGMGWPFLGNPTNVWANYGSYVPWTSRIGDGNWHTIEVHYKGNTYNSGTGHWNKDGIATVYLDGVAGVDDAGIWDEFVNNQDGADTVNPRGLKMFAIGGNTNNYDQTCSGANCWQYSVLDDFCISDSQIGESNCSAADVAPPAAPTGLSVL